LVLGLSITVAIVQGHYLLILQKKQQVTYLLLLRIQQEIIKNLKVGTKLGDLWDLSQKMLEDNDESLIKYFLPNCGGGMGIDLIENNYNICKGNLNLVEENMIFRIRLGLLNIDDDKKYSILISDTVWVSNQGPTVFTEKCDKSLGEISYEIVTEEETKTQEIIDLESEDTAMEKEKEKENSSENDVEEKPSSDDEYVDNKENDERIVNKGKSKDVKISKEILKNHGGFTLRREEELDSIQIGKRTLRNTRGREAKHTNTKDGVDIEHQKKLGEKLIESALKKLKEKSDINNENDDNVVTHPISYSDPIYTNSENISFDFDNDSILIPIYGRSTPFHSNFVTKMTKDSEYLRINFKIPTHKEIELLDQKKN